MPPTRGDGDEHALTVRGPQAEEAVASFPARLHQSANVHSAHDPAVYDLAGAAADSTAGLGVVAAIVGAMLFMNGQSNLAALSLVAAAVLALLARVFGLHPTFTPSTVTCWTEPFEHTRVGWGEFVVKVTIW